MKSHLYYKHHYGMENITEGEQVIKILQWTN